MFTPNQTTVTDLTSLNSSVVDGKNHNIVKRSWAKYVRVHGTNALQFNMIKVFDS